MTGEFCKCVPDPRIPKKPKGVDDSNCTAATGSGCTACEKGYELEKWQKGVFRKCVEKKEEPKVDYRRVTGVDTSNCTSAVGTGCKTCKPGFELDRYVPGRFTKCIAKPMIKPMIKPIIKRVV